MDDKFYTNALRVAFILHSLICAMHTAMHLVWMHRCVAICHYGTQVVKSTTTWGFCSHETTELYWWFHRTVL